MTIIKLVLYSCSFFLINLNNNVLFVQSDDDCKPELRLLCQEQLICGQCMQVHPCCHWCYNQSFPNARCDFLDKLNNLQCGLEYIQKNRVANVTKTLNKHFIDINSPEDANAAIQVRPQKFKVTLRKGQPVNLTFTYKAAKHYPLELYYLGDLSYSMKMHLDTLINLGSRLGEDLQKLTKHYKLAFGSFADKPAMPFVQTDEKHLLNPCKNQEDDNNKELIETCDRTYLFKHSLDFTSDTERFFKTVNYSKISANIDNLDGALEAIFQILVCRKFGWSENSRKIILLSTDSYLHSAGDGLLAGAISVNNNETCLINSEGDHTDPLKYDYPSIPEIKSLLRKHKTNLILAVTMDKHESYMKMEDQLLKQEAFVGILQPNSTNILDLVKQGFYDFIKQVEFSVNTTDAPELQVDFFAKCHSGEYAKVAGCDNVEEGRPIQFKVQLTLKEANIKQGQIVYIRENNINEVIEVDIDYVCGVCQCVNHVRDPNLKCVNGTVDCGKCQCNEGWTGDTCSEECDGNSEKCRKGNGVICSGNGDCICGICQCEKSFEGKYCEYDCPTTKDYKKCGGHGTCFEGICSCFEGWAGTDCSCSSATDECTFQEEPICNGHGVCDCNTCHCEKGYAGQYCEWQNSTTNVLCSMFEEHVKQYFSTNKTRDVTINDTSVTIEELYNGLACGDPCTVVFYKNTQRCSAKFCYHEGETNITPLTVDSKCVYTAQAMGYWTAILIFIAVVVIGIIGILMKKCQISQADKAEYQMFRKELEASKGSRNENPIYHSPVSNYNNPLHESTKTRTSVL